MIAIPNMEKPNRCELCPCSYYSEGALSDICQVTDKPITDGKPTDCPLIEIGDIEYKAFKEFMAIFMSKLDDSILYGERRE